jgi:small subunit ribosomal protein S20
MLLPVEFWSQHRWKRSRFVANTRSAEKMIRVAERRRLRNRTVKSAVKTFIRKAERGIVGAAEDSTELVVQAISKLDKAASKGILHKRNAARRKSRLMKKLNTAGAAS